MIFANPSNFNVLHDLELIVVSKVSSGVKVVFVIRMLHVLHVGCSG